MRTPRILPVLALALSLLVAGCIKEEPVADAAIDEEVPPPAADEAPVEPTPASPSSPPPAATPPPAASPPPPPQEEPLPPPPPPPPRIDVFAWNGTITGVGASASGVCCAQVAPQAENADIAFTVPAGLDGVVVELVWSDPQFDLDLVLGAADYNATPAPPAPYTGHRWHAGDGAPGQPEGHVRLAVTDAEALAILGDWTTHVTAKGPANAVAFTLLVSLHHDAAPAADYTARPSG